MKLSSYSLYGFSGFQCEIKNGNEGFFYSRFVMMKDRSVTKMERSEEIRKNMEIPEQNGSLVFVL